MTIGRRLALLAVIAVILVADQTTKRAVRSTLTDLMPRHYAGTLVTLIYTENPGAFLSLGANLPPQVRAIVFDVVVAIGLLAAMAVLFLGKVTAHGDDLALAAIVGGGVGNLIDRIRFGGRVTDFIYMQLGPVHTGVFNVADMAITFGVLWLLATWAFARKEEKPAPSD
jgi:signal peptidase II